MGIRLLNIQQKASKEFSLNWVFGFFGLNTRFLASLKFEASLVFVCLNTQLLDSNKLAGNSNLAGYSFG